MYCYLNDHRYVIYEFWVYWVGVNSKFTIWHLSKCVVSSKSSTSSKPYVTLNFPCHLNHRCRQKPLIIYIFVSWHPNHLNPLCHLYHFCRVNFSQHLNLTILPNHIHVCLHYEKYEQINIQWIVWGTYVNMLLTLHMYQNILVHLIWIQISYRFMELCSNEGDHTVPFVKASSGIFEINDSFVTSISIVFPVGREG